MGRGTSSAAACAFFGWGAFALLVAALQRNKRPASTLNRNSPASTRFAFTDHVQEDEIKPMWQLEKEAIIRALEKVNGDKLLAAAKLGLGKTTLYRKLKKYGIRVEGTFKALEVHTQNEASTH